MTRKLIVFSDGCWVKPQYRSRKRRVPGNAALAYQCVAPTDPENREQIRHLLDEHRKDTYYSNFMQRFFGLGTQKEIFNAYQFLANNHRDGDEIFLIGAGLGAYSLRRLADLIDKAGLLTPDNLHLLPTAYEYSQIPMEALESPAAQALGELLPRRPVRIRFLGCWDTVGSHGLPTPGLNRISESWMMFTDHKLNSNVDAAYQAIALDERRSRFKPGLWTGTHSPKLKAMEQVWFTGSHENVVGGRRDSGLSDIALTWLLDRAAEAGLYVDREKMEELTAPDVTGRIAMNRRKVFGLPLPFKKTFNRPVGKVSREFSANFDAEPEKLHESVLERQERDKKYRPRQLASLSEGDIPVFRATPGTYVNMRRHKRQSVDWPGFLVSGEAKVNVSLVDYSRTGARVWLNGKPPEGSSLILQSSNAAINGLKSRVVWTRDNFLGLEFAHPLPLGAME
ncbi:phospholipase effector Tle1 domain-containing protein [Sneathiella sp.]|uniref:phospholipase effector Tle1 domain-containing protein n=1 Tax=Sneathiella sp. TaxID=1964365 RepID=UPI00356B073E